QVAREPVRGRAGVGADDRVLGQALRELPDDALWVHRVAVLERAVLDHPPPLLDLALDLLAPRAVLLALELRDQLAQRLLRVADERHVDRVADSGAAGVDVDLDAAGLAFLWEELRVREARPDH